ncbi:DUF1963 domain-containing protein [Micromonospora sp. NPDC049559]|uniref:DUF1963 domain-containing protein n=1 Tax=Micromonospora sp. NPDC049559 TaxID=3155923 RepID=UPI003437959E
MPTGAVDRQAERAELHRLCVDRLGAYAGPRFAAMARPGFRLEPADDDGASADRCWLGGPALLEPGTPWPECAGIPLSPLAVLDTDLLAPWLGTELPGRPGLLNFFVFAPELPYEAVRHVRLDDPVSWRVLPADPARAVPVGAPEPAATFPMARLRAEPVLTLPDQWEYAVDALDFGPDEPDRIPALEVGPVVEAWAERVGARHQAFGWPALESTTPIVPAGEAYTCLLKVLDHPGNPPVVYFTIPTEALRAGDLARARVTYETF